MKINKLIILCILPILSTSIECMQGWSEDDQSSEDHHIVPVSEFDREQSNKRIRNDKQETLTSSTSKKAKRLPNPNVTSNSPIEISDSNQEISDSQSSHELGLQLMRVNTLDEVKDLLAKGANPNAQNRTGCTPLMDATLYGTPDIAQALLDAGARPNTQDNNGLTALMNAFRSDMISLLCNHNANPNIQNKNGRTALMLTIKRQIPNAISVVIPNAISVVKNLLNYGALLDIQDNDGETALTLAEKLNTSEILNILRSHKSIIEEEITGDDNNEEATTDDDNNEEATTDDDNNEETTTDDETGNTTG